MRTAYTTCKGMYGSGLSIAGTIVIRTHRATAVRGRPIVRTHPSVFCVVVRGTALLAIFE